MYRVQSKRVNLLVCLVGNEMIFCYKQELFYDTANIKERKDFLNL